MGRVTVCSFVIVSSFVGANLHLSFFSTRGHHQPVLVKNVFCVFSRKNDCFGFHGVEKFKPALLS